MRRIHEEYHLLTKLEKNLKTQHEFIKEIYIYTPNGGFNLCPKKKLIEKLKNEYKGIDFNIKVYYPYTPNNREKNIQLDYQKLVN